MPQDLECLLANIYSEFRQTDFAKMNSTWDWDDLRLVLAVSREGTLSGAARKLGVTHSTVFRRLGAIEEQMGARLFERFRDGYMPTPAGETAAASAARLEDEVLALERRLSGQDLRPSGTARITTTDTLGAILMRHLPAMRASHPEIQFEIAISNAMANLTRREAEIAIRPMLEPPEILVGRRVADIAHAIYGSRAYLSRREDKTCRLTIGSVLTMRSQIPSSHGGCMKTCGGRRSRAGSTRFLHCAMRHLLASASRCFLAMSEIPLPLCVGSRRRLLPSLDRRSGY